MKLKEANLLKVKAKCYCDHFYMTKKPHIQETRIHWSDQNKIPPLFFSFFILFYYPGALLVHQNKVPLQEIHQRIFLHIKLENVTNNIIMQNSEQQIPSHDVIVLQYQTFPNKCDIVEEPNSSNKHAHRLKEEQI